MANGKEKLFRIEEVASLLPDEVSVHSDRVEHKRWAGKHRMIRMGIDTIGLVSILLNVVLVVLLLQLSNRYQLQQKSRYAGLTFDQTATMSHTGTYGPNNKNETDRALLWESLDASSAQIAIGKTWASTHSLPESDQFSWDDEKVVYSVRAFHGNHCLRKIYRWIAISQHNGTQLDTYEHVLHCIDSLRQDVRCWADDTPMKSTPGSWGEGQMRQCRDWGKLERWVHERNACYSYVNETQGVSSMFERYKWCPPGSPYAERMKKVLNLPQDWSGVAPKDVDSLPAYWNAFG